MTTQHLNSPATGDLEAGAPCSAPRDPTARLFAAALDGDHRAEAALHLLGGLDDTAHRASWALLSADDDLQQPDDPYVLASIDRVLAGLRDRQSDTRAPSDRAPVTRVSMCVRI